MSGANSGSTFRGKPEAPIKLARPKKAKVRRSPS
jgi:hypothetical protein